LRDDLKEFKESTFSSEINILTDDTTRMQDQDPLNLNFNKLNEVISSIDTEDDE